MRTPFWLGPSITENAIILPRQARDKHRKRRFEGKGVFVQVQRPTQEAQQPAVAAGAHAACVVASTEPSLVLAGDWCTESSFEGCAISAIAAAAAVRAALGAAATGTTTTTTAAATSTIRGVFGTTTVLP